jgi:hypothetical protein
MQVVLITTNTGDVASPEVNVSDMTEHRAKDRKQTPTASSTLVHAQISAAHSAYINHDHPVFIYLFLSRDEKPHQQL